MANMTGCKINSRLNRNFCRILFVEFRICKQSVLIFRLRAFFNKAVGWTCMIYEVGLPLFFELSYGGEDVR